MKLTSKILKKIDLFLYKTYLYSKPSIRIFGIFSVINYPAFYFFWDFFDKLIYNDFIYRLICTILGFCLIFHEKWPCRVRKYLPLFWFISVLICVPFYASVMFFRDFAGGSEFWPLNYSLGIIFLILIVDFKSFLILQFLGMISGLLFLKITGQNIFFDWGLFFVTIVNSLWIVVLVLLFGVTKENSFYDKEKALKYFGGLIAHEMRTPIATMKFMSDNISNISEKLLIFYNKNLDEKNPILTKQEIDYIAGFRSDANNITSNAFFLINLLLIKLKQDFHNIQLRKLKISPLLNNALNQYPMTPSEKRFLEVKIDHDFEFMGNELLFNHIIFNLFKNAIYFTHHEESRDKKIIFTTSREGKYNILHILDYGPGIDSDDIDNIFIKYYSQSDIGTGLGLAFSKDAMEHFGGEIKCKSLKGEYSIFSLYFPLP